MDCVEASDGNNDFEKLYEFTFKCPLEDLKSILYEMKDVIKIRRAPSISFLEKEPNEEQNSEAEDHTEETEIIDKVDDGEEIDESCKEASEYIEESVLEYLNENSHSEDVEDNTSQAGDFNKASSENEENDEISEETVDQHNKEVNDQSEKSHEDEEMTEVEFKKESLSDDESETTSLELRFQPTADEDENIDDFANQDEVEKKPTDHVVNQNRMSIKQRISMFENFFENKQDVTQQADDFKEDIEELSEQCAENSEDDSVKDEELEEEDVEDNAISTINPVIKIAYSENDDSTDIDGSEQNNNNDMQELDELIETYGDSIYEEEKVITDGVMSGPPECSDEEDEKQDKEDEEKHLEEADTHLFNTRALPRDRKTYELEKFEKNALIIFNQENIHGYKPRSGTGRDVSELTATFENFGFEIEVHNDLCRDEIFAELKRFSETDFTEYGCVAAAVLTHGSDLGSLRAKDRRFYESDLINFFKTHDKPTLITKPKIIMIQACRGSKTSQAVMTFRESVIRKDQAFDDLPYTLPIESDMLVVHSTYAGNISIRDELNGTWFIQTLCKKINELATSLDLESILTEVKREVAIDKFYEEYNRRTQDIDINKQMPVVTSTLIRKLFLRKHGDSNIGLNVDYSENATCVDNDTEENESEKYTKEAKGVCGCLLDRFYYLRDCIRHFVADNPEDELATSFMEVAEALDGSEFNEAKRKISKAISSYLMNNAREQDYYKYLYFYKEL